MLLPIESDNEAVLTCNLISRDATKANLRASLNRTSVRHTPCREFKASAKIQLVRRTLR